MKKKLYLSTDDRKLGGVCGGLGEWLGVDPNIVRILAIPLVLFTGLFPLVLTYIAAWVILPETPRLIGRPAWESLGEEAAHSQVA